MPRDAFLPSGVALEPIRADLTGRLAVVTGATAGIGFEVAAGLARLGAAVVLVGRSEQSTIHTRGRLVELGLPADLLHTATADLARPAQVAALGNQLCERFDRIDVLVNNAACYPAGRVVTPDGFEESWATNVLGYEVLTTRLQDRLRASGGRLVYLSSSMAGGLDPDDLLWDRRRFLGSRAYAQSKQANRMLAWAWHRRLSAPDVDGGAPVTVNVAHPDGTATNIAHRQKGLWGWVMRWAFSTQRPPAEGADTPLWLAADDAWTGRTGGGFYVRRTLLDCKYYDDVEGSEGLWELAQDQIKPFL